jgi:hypothetical protein
MLAFKLIAGLVVLVSLVVLSLYSLKEDEDNDIAQAKCDTLNDMMSLL